MPAAERGGKVKTIAHNWHMKFKEARARRRGVEGPVAHSIYPRSAVRALILFSSFQFAGNLHFLPPCWNCLFIPLSFKEPLVAIPQPPPTPSVLAARPLWNFISISLPPTVASHRRATERLVVASATKPAAPHLPLYRETILHLRRDYASLADNRKYAIE